MMVRTISARAGPFGMDALSLNLRISFVIALAATFGSLFVSEVLGYPPCSLCWYQRIAMFPLNVIFFVALWCDDRRYARYSLPLCAVGLAIAGYHNLLYFGVISAPNRTVHGGRLMHDAASGAAGIRNGSAHVSCGLPVPRRAGSGRLGPQERFITMKGQVFAGAVVGVGVVCFAVFAMLCGRSQDQSVASESWYGGRADFSAEPRGRVAGVLE